VTAAKNREEERPARLSYVTAAVSGALVLALIAYLTVHAVRTDRPAAIVAEPVPGEAWIEAEVRYVPVDVTNRGDLSAAEIVIEAAIPGTTASAIGTIGYLAGGETQRIYLALPRSPPESAVTARVVAFQEP
jgi:uncharacterized protein (TIGR02588 family)